MSSREILGRGPREPAHGEIVDDQKQDRGELGHALTAGAREGGIGELVE